ncbi:hypothetical protein [Pontiella desulfatans]|uniref:hypothetical protein n=1 Tax=Pontiella desulfatans TaxID=2750659 RepID=UPI00109C76CB|nr:hypothetical protein [Pontiella desulfatans]
MNGLTTEERDCSIALCLGDLCGKKQICLIGHDSHQSGFAVEKMTEQLGQNDFLYAVTMNYFVLIILSEKLHKKRLWVVRLGTQNGKK